MGAVWAAAVSAAPSTLRAQGPASYEVYAVRYATLPGFPVASLVAGADTSRRLDIAMMVWVVRAADRVVLVDAGFYRDKFIERWKPAGFVKPSEAVARLGIRPEDVTDIVVTHVHWDHLDGIDLFPHARVWLQRNEFEHHVDSAGQARNRVIDPENALILARFNATGRLRLAEGDGQEILPGITVHTGGRHTYASQYVTVRTPAGTVVLASDNLYLDENLERRAPIAQTLDAESNLRAQDRMRGLASDRRLIVPGHEPAVFQRFQPVADGVVRIR